MTVRYANEGDLALLRGHDGISARMSCNAASRQNESFSYWTEAAPPDGCGIICFGTTSLF